MFKYLKRISLIRSVVDGLIVYLFKHNTTRGDNEKKIDKTFVG